MAASAATASRTPRFDAAPITASSHATPGRFSSESSCRSMTGGATTLKTVALKARRRPGWVIQGAHTGVRMPRMVKCAKLGKELPGLEFKPWNNELGQRIYESISQDAWKMWLEHFKMIMNEYRLAGGSEQANQVLFDQAEKFFFGEGAQLPPDYKPPAAKG